MAWRIIWFLCLYSLRTNTARSFAGPQFVFACLIAFKGSASPPKIYTKTTGTVLYIYKQKPTIFSKLYAKSTLRGD